MCTSLNNTQQTTYKHSLTHASYNIHNGNMKARKCYIVLLFLLVLTIFNEGAYLTLKSIFHKAPHCGLGQNSLYCRYTMEAINCV